MIAIIHHILLVFLDLIKGKMKDKAKKLSINHANMIGALEALIKLG